MPLFRACACYKNVFCSLSSPLPREHCRVRCPRKNGDGGRRVSDRAPATGMQDKKLQHGAPPVGDARGYLPRRSRGTRPYRASFFGDFGTRCTSFAVRGLRKVFLRRCHQRSIVRVCSPAVLRSCPAPSSTTFRLPRQRVSSSSTIRQTKCGGGPRPPLFGGSASPRERPSSSTPPGNVSSPRCARCQRGPRRPAASSKRRPGINRRAICFFFSFIFVVLVPYPALPSCASNALAVTPTRSVCPFHHSSCEAVLHLYCSRNTHGVQIVSSCRSCPLDYKQLRRTT